MSLLAVRACCAATPNPSSYPVLLAYASSLRLLGLVSQCAASFRSLLYSLGLGIVCLSLCLVYPSRITPLNVYAPSSPRPFHPVFTTATKARIPTIHHTHARIHVAILVRTSAYPYRTLSIFARIAPLSYRIPRTPQTLVRASLYHIATITPSRCVRRVDPLPRPGPLSACLHFLLRDIEPLCVL